MRRKVRITSCHVPTDNPCRRMQNLAHDVTLFSLIIINMIYSIANCQLECGILYLQTLFTVN